MSPDRSRLAVVGLATCMALNQTSLSLIMTVAALSGRMLAGADAGLATLPLACLFVAIMATTIPASLFMDRFGRRAGFSLGAGTGILGGAIGALAIWWGDLWLLCLGLALYGVAAGCANYYRFAAAEVAPPAFRSRAISAVLIGGVVAAVAGPFLASQGKDALAPYSFAGSYVAVALLSCLIFPVLFSLRFPPETRGRAARVAPGPGAQELPARPLGQILRQPKFIVAALGAMIGYGSMNLLMVSTPLAMDACGFAFADAASVIQWHVLGMYVPSFFSGHLIRRFGVLRIMAIGALVIMVAAAINLHGVTYTHFWAALILLGLGWNFLFVGGTTLLTECYRPSERAKTQAANEFLVFGTTALTALSSGAVFSGGGWEVLNVGVLPALGLVLLAIAWLSLGRRRRSAAA